MPPIYAFNLVLKVDCSNEYSHEYRGLPATGFSGISNLEESLWLVAPFARRCAKYYLTHYPKLNLVVATGRPHFDPPSHYGEDPTTFEKTYSLLENRFITRRDLLLKCPSLAKFNGCLSCPYLAGSLPCFSKALPGLSSSRNLGEDPLAYKDLPQMYWFQRNKGWHANSSANGEGFVWVAPSHAVDHRYQYKHGVITGVDSIVPYDAITRNIEDASDAAKRAHETRKKLTQCHLCYFSRRCQKRWVIRRCLKPYSQELVVEELSQNVRRACQRAAISLDELKYFINAGGHEVYPYRFRMTFRGLSSDLKEGVFHSGEGRRHEYFNLKETRRLLQARFFHGGAYTESVDQEYGRAYDVSDEMLGAYYEIIQQNLYKTGNGWTCYSGINYVRATDNSLRIGFYRTRWTVTVRSYAELQHRLPRWLSILK